MQLALPLPQHYRFQAMIDAHGWPQLAPYVWEPDESVLERVEQLKDGSVVLLRMRPSETAVDVEVRGAALDAARLQEAEQVVRWITQLDENFDEFYRFCAEHPRLRHIPGRGLGPMLRGSTVWEDYVKTVCTTNTTWAQTRGMVARLVEAYGAPLGDGSAHAFPAPEVIAQTSLEAFAATVRAGYRAPYIHTSAVEIAAGRLDLERFKRMAREVETPELMAELRRLRGIGPYAAAHIALLLGSYGHIPSDSWARELVRRHLRGGAPTTDKDVHTHFAHFGRWKALAFRCWDWDGATDGA